MELNRGAVGGGRGYGAPDGLQLRRRERKLAAQLHELLFPSTPPSPTGGLGAASSSELCGSSEHGSSLVKAPASGSGGQRRGRGSKRVQEEEQRHQEEREQRGGCSTTAVQATRCRRKKQGTASTTTLVTTEPAFDGYQWRKYGQKQIEAAQYARSYYRCTHSTDKACPAKRTLQRNNDVDGDSGPPKYTVVYISEHSCMATGEAVATPTILESSVVFPSSSRAISTGTQSLASSDTTWSDGTAAGANPTPNECSDCWNMFAADGDRWELDPTPAAPAAAAALPQEMDFAGPIMSPVHLASADGSWIHDLFVNESPFVPSSCNSFGF